MQLDLVSLRYFVTIAAQKSFRKAATELHISQPALSRRVQMLEDALGVPLLMRHGRGVTPTAAGEILRKRAEAMLRLESEIQSDVRSTSTRPIGHLRVAATPSCGQLLIAGIVNRFLESYPEITWSLTEGFSNEVQRKLLDDSVDVGLLTQGPDHPDLIYQPLYEEKLCLIYSARALPAIAGPVSVGQVSALPIMTAPVILDLLTRHGARQCQVRVELNGTSHTGELIAAGGGYFVGQRAQFWEEIRSGAFRAVDIENVTVRRCLATRIDRPLSLAATMLVDEVKRGVREISAWPESPFLPLSS